MPEVQTTSLVVILSALPVLGLWAQSSWDRTQPAPYNTSQAQTLLSEERAIRGDLPLRRLALFSSGVGFFQHTGTINGSTELSLPFNVNAVNDALKSLVINDPDSSPSVSYPSEHTLSRTLKSLTIDLPGNSGIAELLDSLRGEEIEVSVPNPIRGRIILVEYHAESNRGQETREADSYLSLYTPQGIRVIRLRDINSFAFQDPQINADLERALDLIMGSRDSDTRNLLVRLPGKTQREVSLNYVIPAPIWKVSYRLDLSQEQPFLQGWAIVDNDGDTDWDQVELALVTGRPVSFIQNLYAPYYLARPMLPLAIAGIAEARTYDSGSAGRGMGYDMVQDKRAVAEEMSVSPQNAPVYTKSMESSLNAYEPPSPAVARDTVETARGRAAGDQFEFTIKKPVSLARQQSAMLPLVEGIVQAEKTLVFSGARAVPGRSGNPAISAELTNSTGMKLPAGPITVYDGGTYAGDALIEFFPEGEKRIISYGEDLSVTGSVNVSNNRTVTTVTIRQGIMTVNRKQSYEKIYTFRNASGASKRLIVEHPITPGTSLTMPTSYTEKTDTLYRFVQTLQQGEELRFTVQEERPLSEGIILSQLTLSSFVSYAANQEIPLKVRTALQTAITLKQQVDEAKQTLSNLENQRKRLIAEQDRTRRNLEAAGNQTPQGQDYLKRLAFQDGEIDAVNQEIAVAEQAVQTAQKEYDTYLGEMILE